VALLDRQHIARDWVTLVMDQRSAALANTLELEKDGDWLGWGPMHHWTDSKIRLHASYHMPGLSLLQYLHKQAETVWPGLSVEQLLEELRQIQQSVLLYPPQSIDSAGSTQLARPLPSKLPLGRLPGNHAARVPEVSLILRRRIEGPAQSRRLDRTGQIGPLPTACPPSGARDPERGKYGGRATTWFRPRR
jgi:hypothetical protein